MKRPSLRPTLPLLAATALAAGLFATAGPAPADRDDREWQDDDRMHDRARRAVDRGEILPIEKLLEKLKIEIPGEVIDVELDREKQRWIYEFKILDRDGRVLEVEMDAGSAEILSTEEE